MSRFQKATGGSFVTLKEEKASDKVKFIGTRVVGMFLKHEPSIKYPESRTYHIHTFQDPDDAAMFEGKEPDGELVMMGGSTVIDGAFDSRNIPVGAIVEIIYLGVKEGRNGEFDNFEVGFFLPKPGFKKATPEEREEGEQDALPPADEEEAFARQGSTRTATRKTPSKRPDPVPQSRPGRVTPQSDNKSLDELGLG